MLLGFKRQRSATDRDVDRAAQDPSAAEGAIREGYRPSRHPVSSLALGPRGQVQTANFTVTRTLVLAGAGFNQSPLLVNLAGLFQRASIVTGFGWLTTISAQALTRASAAPARKPST